MTAILLFEIKTEQPQIFIEEDYIFATERKT